MVDVRLADLPQRSASCATCPFRHDVDTADLSPDVWRLVDGCVDWLGGWVCHNTTVDGRVTDRSSRCAQGKLGGRYG